MTKKKLITLILDFIFVILLIIGDQVTKSAAIANLKGQESIKLIDGVLHLHYLENFGAAFGMLQNQKLFFIFMAAIILFIILFTASQPLQLLLYAFCFLPRRTRLNGRFQTPRPSLPCNQFQSARVSAFLCLCRGRGTRADNA